MTEPAHNCPPEPRTPNGTLPSPEVLLTNSLGAANGNPAPLPIPGRNGIPINAIVHGACRSWWTGGERSHCGGCCRTYTSLSAFDRHRRGGQCLDPQTAGLIARQKPYGLLWGWPGPDGGMAATRHHTT